MKSSKRCILQNHFENSTDFKSNKSELSISSHFNSIQYLVFVYHQIERAFLEFYSKNNTIFVKYLFSLDIYNSSSNEVGAHTFNTTSIKLNWILRTALNRSVLSIVRSAHLFAKKTTSGLIRPQKIMTLSISQQIFDGHQHHMMSLKTSTKRNQ